MFSLFMLDAGELAASAVLLIPVRQAVGDTDLEGTEETQDLFPVPVPEAEAEVLQQFCLMVFL